MITLRKAAERRHHRSHKLEIWHSFQTDDGASPADRFASVLALDEEQLRPGAAAAPHPQRDAEIVTYVREGAVAHEDSMGRSGVIHAGEFQHMATGRGIRHSERNASRTATAQIFQIWLRPSDAHLDPSQQQKRFSAAERSGGLCAIASPDGRRGSLLMHQDSLLFSAILNPGMHVVHALQPGRGAWLHVVSGDVVLDDIALTTGDGVGVTDERTVSVTARGDTEILLLDVGTGMLASLTNRGRP